MRTAPTSPALPRAAVLAAALLAAHAAAEPPEPSAVELRGSARAWVGTGADTNPRRDFTSPGVSPPVDVFGSATAELAGSLDTDRVHLSGNYQGGGRKFFLLPSEDTEVQTANAALSVDLARFLALGLDASARDRRGAERDYSDLMAEAFLDFFPDRHVDLRLHGGAHRFLFWDRFDYSFAAPAFGATARYRFDKRHALSVYADYEPRKFNAQAAADPNLSDPPVLGTRKDSFISVGVGYSYRGPFQLGADYGFIDASSNSFGQSFRRHRIALRGGVRLPLGFLAMGQAVLQLVQYPDGVYLSPDLIVLEDDENSSSLSLKLLHPIGSHADLEARYGLYYARLPNNGLSYWRQVFTFGMAFHY